MLTKADLQTRFLQHSEGILIHNPLEGVMVIEFDDLPELILLAAKALQDRKPVDMTARME